MVIFGVISSGEDDMLSVFFEEGLRVNTIVFVHIMKKLVKPWINIITGYRLYTFEQYRAPAYNTNKTQAWLEEN